MPSRVDSEQENPRLAARCCCRDSGELDEESRRGRKEKQGSKQRARLPWAMGLGEAAMDGQRELGARREAEACRGGATAMELGAGKERAKATEMRAWGR